MKLSKMLSAAVIAAMLAPLPAAASDLTSADQRRSAQRAEVRKHLALKRAELRQATRERRLSAARRHDMLRGQQRLRMALRKMQIRMAQRMRIRRF